MSVELERLDDRLKSQVPFGRNQALGALGAALFGLATRMVSPRTVSAAHSAVPSPCYGYGRCHCCNRTSCCASGCSYNKYLGCPSGGQCWYSCGNGNQGYGLYQCCDYSSPEGPCICHTLRATSC